MIQKKVCILGAFGVGKTSLVSRFVHRKFSEKYLSTMGVKIDRKRVTVNETCVNMMLWDIHGEEAYKKIPASYLRGASAIILVMDGTRAETVDVAQGIMKRVHESLGDIPAVYLVNKCDLVDEWILSEDVLASLEHQGHPLFRTSAKTGAYVTEAFQVLAAALISS